MEIHDRILEAYQGKMGESFMRETHRRIHWICRQVLGNDILDVGCSQGIVPVLLGREGMRVLGVDIDPLAVDAANAFLSDQPEQVREKVRFECADFMSLDLSASLYDTVILTEVLEHLVDPERFVEKAQSLLKDGGCLVVTVPFGINDFIDHKSTFYLSGPYSLLEKHFSVVRVECLGKWIGFQCIKGTVPDAVSIDSGQMALIGSLESAFQEIERRLVDDRSRLHNDLSKANTSYRESCNEIQSLRSKVDDMLRAQASEQAEQSQLRLEALHALALEKTRLQERMAMFDTMMQRESVRVEQDHSFRDKLLEKAEHRVTQLESRCDDFGRELRELGEQLAVTTGERDASRREVEALTARCDALGRELRELGEQLAVTTGERDAGRREVEGLTARCDDLDRELCEARDHWRSESEAKDLEISGLRESYNVAQTKRDGHYKNLVAAQKERDKLRVERDKLREQLTVAEQKRSGHYAHLQKAIERYSQSEARVRDITGSIAWAVGVLFTRTRGIGSLMRNSRNVFRALRSRRRRTYRPVDGSSVGAVQPLSVPAAPLSSSKNDSTLKYVSSGAQCCDLSIVGWPPFERKHEVVGMSVMDEFSRVCFGSLLDLIQPRPDNWKPLLERDNPQFLFVESSWKGNFGTWQYRVAKYAHPPGKELEEMVAEFRNRKIPTVFWNKEDPVHFEQFADSASGFEYIFTTAEEAIPLYQKRSQAKVGVLSFAADPSIHHPIGSSSRQDRVCFAGSYYLNRFQERREDQLMLLRAAIPYGLDIYDRNASNGSKDFQFPDDFKDCIRGGLSYQDTCESYRKYRVFLNVNSVIDSRTMFSRRVYELMACGTPVVSTQSLGIEVTFGKDLVWLVRDANEAGEAIRALMENRDEWRRRSIRGIREVYSRHTYAHRLNHVFETIGIGGNGSGPKRVMVVCSVGSERDYETHMRNWNRQESSLFVARLRMYTEDRKIHRKHPDVKLIERKEDGLSDLHAELKAFEATHFCRFHANATYGRWFLLDSLLAFDYSGACLVGKPESGEDAYAYGVRTHPASAVVDLAQLARIGVKPAIDFSELVTFISQKDGRVFAHDAANFSIDTNKLSEERLREVWSRIEV